MRELRHDEWKREQGRIESANLDDISQIRAQHTHYTSDSEHGQVA
jgi:hypothetical protein